MVDLPEGQRVLHGEANRGLQENAVVCIMRWGEEAGPLIWRERGRTGRGTIDGRNVDRCKYYIELHIVELKIWKYSCMQTKEVLIRNTSYFNEIEFNTHLITHEW